MEIVSLKNPNFANNCASSHTLLLSIGGYCAHLCAEWRRIGGRKRDYRIENDSQSLLLSSTVYCGNTKRATESVSNLLSGVVRPRGGTSLRRFKLHAPRKRTARIYRTRDRRSLWRLPRQVRCVNKEWLLYVYVCARAYYGSRYLHPFIVLFAFPLAFVLRNGTLLMHVSRGRVHEKIFVRRIWTRFPSRDIRIIFLNSVCEYFQRFNLAIIQFNYKFLNLIAENFEVFRNRSYKIKIKIPRNLKTWCSNYNELDTRRGRLDRA